MVSSDCLAIAMFERFEVAPTQEKSEELIVYSNFPGKDKKHECSPSCAESHPCRSKLNNVLNREVVQKIWCYDNSKRLSNLRLDLLGVADSTSYNHLIEFVENRSTGKNHVVLGQDFTFNVENGQAIIRYRFLTGCNKTLGQLKLVLKSDKGQVLAESEPFTVYTKLPKKNITELSQLELEKQIKSCEKLYAEHLSKAKMVEEKLNQLKQLLDIKATKSSQPEDNLPSQFDGFTETDIKMTDENLDFFDADAIFDAYGDGDPVVRKQETFGRQTSFNLLTVDESMGNEEIINSFFNEATDAGATMLFDFTDPEDDGSVTKKRKLRSAVNAVTTRADSISSASTAPSFFQNVTAYVYRLFF